MNFIILKKISNKSVVECGLLRALEVQDRGIATRHAYGKVKLKQKKIPNTWKDIWDFKAPKMEP